MRIKKVKRVKNLFGALLSFTSIKKWGVISETYEITKFDHAFSISYSQSAEDLVLQQVLGSRMGFYIDVGAHHPSRFSVTRLLYQSGWSGINVDANPDIAKLFKRERPRDKFIWAAIGNSAHYEFFQFMEPAISTTNNSWKDRFEAEGNSVINEIQVPGLRLFDLIRKLPEDQEVDLLNIDIEGSDFDAFQSLNLSELPSKKIPKFLVLESSWPISLAIKTDSVQLAISQGYEPILVLPMTTILRWPSLTSSGN